MSRQLAEAFAELQRMPHYKNDAAKSGRIINGHEDAIRQRFLNAGFQEITKGSIPPLLKAIAREWIETGFEPLVFLLEKTDREYKRTPEKTRRFKHMPLGSFICQPGGSHSFPDFLLRDFDGRFIAIEAKSGGKKELKDPNEAASTGSPMWNDNLPKHGAIYIYSNEVVDQTTFAMGEDLISKETQILSEKYIRALAAVDDEYRKLFSNEDGFFTTFRQQHFQKSDWFKHPKRKQREDRVINFVK